MSTISLRKLVRKSKGTHFWRGIVEAGNNGISIINPDNSVVFGNEPGTDSEKYPIEANGDIIGYVCGKDTAGILAEFLKDQIEKEDEKKQIANEVLSLYREINLIYNFSDLLAQSIDPDAIGKMVLEEASNLIEATAGAVIMLDEHGGSPEILASFGNPFILESDLSNSDSFWNQVCASKQSEIRDVMPEEISPSSIIHAPLKVKHRLMGSIILVHENKVDHSAADLKLLTTLALQTSSAIESALLYEKRIKEAEEREEAMRQIHEVTMKFVPYEFIQSLGREKLIDVQLGDQVEQEVTVLFLDIRDFTSLAEQMSPEDNFKFVNAFNRRLGPLIREHKGFVNQYLGDGIMAIFPDNATDALRAAVAIQQSLLTFNEKRISIGQNPIKVGIGMYTGSLIMGITGDEQRLDAATISDTVNTASRIESLTKHYGVNVLLSETTYRQIEDKTKFHFRYLGKVQVKGKSKPIKLYECFSGDSSQAIAQKSYILPFFEKGLNAFHNRAFEKALDSFQEVLNTNPKDKAAILFKQKSKIFADEGVSNDWEGVEMMNKK